MNQSQAAVSDCGKCPVCGGTGWELYTETVCDYQAPTQMQFARKCPYCSGQRRAQEDTGIPETFLNAEYAKFDFDAYSRDLARMKSLCENFVQNFGQWDRGNKGFYFWSRTPGSGKTFLACCLARSVMIKHDLQMRFITAPDYIAAVAEGYKQRERGQEDASEVYRRCRVLVLDDVGAQMDKDWHRQEMFRLVNRRMEEAGITLYTSNFPVESLNVDERTKDRIIKSSVVLQMPEESIRRKKAAEEQEGFLKMVMESKGGMT